MKYYYIKDDMGDYYHRNKHRWLNRESVIPYTSKEKLYKYLSNKESFLWTVWKHVNWKVVEVEISEEKDVFALKKENFSEL